MNDWFKDHKAMKDKITNVSQLVPTGTRIFSAVILQGKLILAGCSTRRAPMYRENEARLRSKLWWPEMDKMTEADCKSRFECQLVSQPT